MITETVVQERVLPKNCRILGFIFDFELAGCKCSLMYVNEWDEKDRDDDLLRPIGYYHKDNALYYKFKPASVDRVFQIYICPIELIEQDEDMLYEEH